MDAEEDGLAKTGLGLAVTWMMLAPLFPLSSALSLASSPASMEGETGDA
jgi:hypothetical protein